MAEAPATVGLAHGHELHVAHVHVGGQIHRPPHGFGDVFRGQGIQVFVSGFRSLQVTLETHGQKFSVQMTGLDVGHADGSTQKVAAEHPAKMVHESLGSTVHVAALEGAVAGDGADVDDVTGTAFDHTGQNAAGAVQQAVDVGGDHFVPVVHVARLGGILADGTAGVVQQHVDVLEPFGKIGEHFHHNITLGDVETEGEEISAQFSGEFVEAGLTAAGTNDLPAFLDEAAGGFATNTGGNTSDEDDFLGHV